MVKALAILLDEDQVYPGSVLRDLGHERRSGSNDRGPEAPIEIFARSGEGIDIGKPGRFPARSNDGEPRVEIALQDLVLGGGVRVPVPYDAGGGRQLNQP